jgi:site-specific DNA-cytosine methylase
MPKYKPLYSLYKGLKENKYDVPDSYVSFQKTLTQPGNAGAKSRRGLYQSLKDSNYDVPDTYEDFYKNLFVPVNSTTSRALKIGENPNTPMVNRYRQKMFDSVDPNKNGLNALYHRAVGQAVRATNNVRKPVIAKVLNKKGKPTGEEFAITPAKTVEDLDREYAQAVSKNWENELHDQMADADKDAAKISDMFKSFIGSTDEVGSVWGNMTRGGGIAGTPHSVTTNNGILENTEARQILAAGDYNRKRRELLQLEQDSRNGAIFDNHSFFRGMYDAAKDTGFLTGGASDLINAGSLLATKQDLDNGVHTEAGDMLMQQAVKNSDAQSQYGDNQGWMYTGGVITTNMAPFMVQIGSAGFSKGMSNTIGKAVQGAASNVALGTMEKATGMAGAHIANYIGKVTGLTTKAFGKAIQYGIVGAAQANTVGLGNVANDVVNRYTGQVYQDEHGDYKFGTFDSDGKLVHEGGEDFLTALVKGEAAQTIEFATELAGGGIDAVGTALKNFVTKGGKKIINKYNMENVSKVIDFLLNNKVAKNARYLKAGADRTLGKVEVNSIVGESLEEELGIIANTVFTGDNKISDLWDEKQQSQIWGGMLLSIGLMKGAVAPFHAYNAKQYYSYKHKLDKADVNLSQLLGKEKWEELRNQIDATTNDDMPEMVNKINRDVALGKSRQPVREYIQNLLIMRGYDIGNMLAAKKAVEDKGEGVSVKNMEKNQAYQQGRDAYGYDTHEIQLDQEDKQKSLAQLLGISEQQLASMSDEELEALSGRDDNIDRAIYDYQLSTARYEGVIDNARDQIDLEVQRAAQAVDMYTDKSRNTIRNATIKATGGLEDYGVYIINGNIATHEDGSIDISNSDDMILYYDPTTNTVEHADAMMFAELGSEENADEVRSQAMADAKEKAIKETTGIIDGVVDVGTQFKTVDADGTEHTYEVLADNGDGTAMITIDGNIPTELVKGENVNVPVSFEELQKMKDESDQQRLQAAKAEREQMEKERTERQNQQTEQTEETQPSFDFNQILNDDGNVVLVDVLDKDSNTKYPNSQLFLIRDSGAKAKVMELTSDGSFIPHAVNKKDVRTATTMTLDEYKQAMAESSMIEDNSGESRGEIEVETPTIEGETAAPESAETPATEQTPAVPAITLEDGTIVPMLEDGNPDFSKLTAAQTAELYDSQFGEDADSIVSGYVSDAKKALDKASNMTVKGKTFVEQKAAKDAKEKAIADAKAAYDSAIAIRDAYNERQLAKVEDTAEGRKELIEKARRKFARLKSAVKNDAEAVAQIYKETVGSLLHRLYDGTGIDVTDTIPLTAEEYVASNLGAHSLNYEGTETSKGVKQETGLSRKDFAETQLLAADGKGTTIDNLVHSLWENRPSNLDSLDTQDIRNALLSIITSGFKASEARNYIENLRIARAENFKEEEKKAADNAAFAKEQKAKQEEEQGETEQENTDKEKNEKINEQTNENINAPEQNKFPDKLREGSKTIEVPEDATDENPLGLQLSEDKVPFEIEGGKSGETYNINDNEDRQRLINDNKVDDKDILDIDMPKHVHKAIKELCKKMGLKVQFLYMGARSNGWIENGTMYLALDTEKATQFVFGHEMTHAIKQKNPEAYKELVKVAMAITTRKKFEEDLAKIYQNYYGISGYNNIDDYVEEVVADKLGKFINDFDLAQKFSLRLNHPVLATILHAIQKIKGLLYGDFYKSVDALERIVEKAYVDTAKGEVTNSETGEDVSFSLRQKPEPKKKGIGYKVFVLKDGKLYPPMVANPDGAATPVGVWLDADAAPIAGESKTGRPQVKQGGKGTQGGSGKLAYRPGWHLGIVPYAIQFNRKDAEGNKTLFPKNFVFAEVEYAADVDYQEEARQEGINPSGKYQHSLAGLKHLPTDGYYMYRTNPNPETDPWVITGAMKVNRILTRAEQADLVSKAGREPQQIQEGDIVTDDVVNSINQEIADAPKFSLKVYHGSGADFTEFDFDHMGEGAGSQAFGWGGYVTSSEEIGKSYVELTRKKPTYVYNGKEMSEDDLRSVLLDKVGIDNANILYDFLYNLEKYGVSEAKSILRKGDYAYFKDLLKGTYGSIRSGYQNKVDAAELILAPRNIRVKKYKGNLYEVDIPDDNGNNYLDWDAPLTDKQKNTIIKELRRLKIDFADFKKRGFSFDGSFGGNSYDFLMYALRKTKKWKDVNASRAVSKFLSSIGFTGIKYKAGTIFGGAEEGDTNYVIFKPEDMKITEHTKFSLKSKPVRFEAGKKLSDEEKKEVLSTLKDAYKVNGVPFHIEETAGGKEKRVYEPTADSYVVSDITNRPLRYYITLPDGRVAHPTEVYPNISDNEVKSSATKQGLLDEEVDQIVSAAIGNMKDIADNAKAVEVLTELQNLPHETHDVGYGMNNAQSYNYKTGIFTSDAAQAIDYVVRRMRRKEDVPAEVPTALKKAVADSYGMVDNLIDGMSSTNFSLKDNQGNPLNQDGTFKLDKIKSVDELTDEDFTSAFRNVEFPAIPKNVDAAIGANGKPVVIKKNIFEKNWNAHKFTPAESKKVLNDALYNTDLVGHTQPTKKPNHWVAIKLDDKSPITVLEVNDNKDNVEVVGWYTLDERNLGRIKRQAERNGGELIMLTPKDDKVESLSTPPLSSAANIINSFETTKENGEKVDVEGTKFSLKDEEYLKAVEDGNMEKAQKMVNEAADAAGYSTDSSYQGTSAFNGAAPWGNGYFLTKDERKEAWDNGEFEGESTLGDYINDDIDGGNLEELTNAASYRAADPMRKEAIDNVRNAIQKKAKTITMYRSVPSDVKEGSFRNGDWVTPSRAYAVDNAKLHGWGDDYNIIEQKVPVDDVWFDGNDIAEWGYGREEDYINDTDFAYKNSKNNKKLLDAVTYDDNGNVIPLSQRFNEKNKDVRFSLKDEKIKSVAEKFGVNEDDVAMYANAVEKGSTAEAARARANIKRYLLQANEDKISSFKELMKYTVPVNEALKENFGDLDAMIEEQRKQVEAERNAMEAARKRAQEEEEKRQKHLDELSLIPTDELDKRYMDAISNNDESTAREMLDESARRNGYGDVDSDYQGQGAWAAPSNPQYESDEARRADIENSPDVNLEDIALGYSLQPDDYFDNPRAYMNNTAYGLESAHVIKNALDAIKNGEKDVKVKVYRAVPTSVKEGKLRNGDWVTPSKKYAEMHGDNRLEGKYRIIEDEVPANQLWWDGNDANEFGFDDGKEYRYKNAKNNRKLNDLITYDNKGYVIPPSKRFNSRKNDIRFSLAGERGAAAADKAEERNARMDNLSVARKMEEEKKDAKAIKMATGWERGADGKWRYEMPDAKIKDTMDVGGGHIVKRYEDDMLWNGGKLFDVIDAPELFKAYPQLKGVRIDTDAIMNDMPSHGEYDSKTNTITIHADELKYMNDILNHEIQHAIQGIEGFATGGSPTTIRGEVKKRFNEVTKQIKQLRAEGKEDEAKALIEKNRGLYDAYMKNDDFNSYKSLAGEVEARNVQERMNMTPEERRKTLAESTEDVARKDQIFLGVGDVSFSIRDMADGKESGAADMAEDLKSLNTPDEVDDAIKTAIEDMPSGWKMANKKMIHIAQALGENRKAEIAGEEPKFSLKDGTLIKAGTYFSGGGLVEEGLKGIIDPVVAVEYDEKISGVYRNNFGQHIVTADVRDVDPKELVKQIDGEVEYFHASPVCKNYSQAKSNHAEVELDKETAASTAEFINAVKPMVVTIENVKGYKDSDAMKIITDALDANGYTWDADVYNAADYGGYTNRERLIVRAVRDGKLPAKPEKMARKSGWYEAVADIIPTLTEKKNGVAPWMDIRLKADGIDWRNIDKPLYVMGSAYADGKVPHAFADELLPTLRTKSGDVIVMPDGKVYRAMGRVLARVSGVSDDYKMPFSENLSHTIIGNGIPTQLTEHVIAPLLTGSDPKFSIRTYHGTGASFDKFDLSHAFEGEGSETFGHGVYNPNSL